MKEFKAPDPLKSEEVTFEKSMEAMITLMSRMYKNQVILELDKGTVEKFADNLKSFSDSQLKAPITRRVKFIDGYTKRTVYDYDRDDSGDEYPVNEREIDEPVFKHKDELMSIHPASIIDGDRLHFQDAQVGNYAAVLTKLANSLQRKLLKRFSNARLKEVSTKVLTSNDRRSKKLFYEHAAKSLGVDPLTLMNDGTQYDMNALIIETTAWAKKLRDQTLEEYTANTLRAMTLGETVETILEKYDGLVEKRKNHAEFTARNQIANTNSIMNKTRAQKLGITKAIWVSSHDGERVRPSHRWRDGREFDLSKGLYSSMDGQFLLPGTDYNCFTDESKVNNTSFIRKFYSRRYAGKLSNIVSDDGAVLASTANHPILTVDGFKPAHLVGAGDYIIKTFDKTVELVELYGKDVIPTFKEIFSSLNLLGVEHTIAPSNTGKFHGDISDGEIDIISMDSLLSHELNASVCKKFFELELTSTEQKVVLDFFTCRGEGFSSFNAFGLSSYRVVSILNLFRSRFVAHLTPLERFCFTLCSWCDAGLDYSSSYSVTADTEMFRDHVFALSVLVHGDYIFDRKVELLSVGSLNTSKGESNLLGAFAKNGWVHRDLSGDIFDESAIKYKLCKVTDNFVSDFSGHVYNLETISNDYIVNTAAVSNCRCGYIMVIPDEED